MIFQFIAAAASVVGVASSISARNSQRRAQEQAAEDQRRAAEAAAKRNNKIALQTWRQQVRQLRLNYNNAKRERNWNHLTALSDFRLQEIGRIGQARLQEQQSENELATNELNRYFQYELERLAYAEAVQQERFGYKSSAIEYQSSKLKDRAAYDERRFAVELENLQGQAGSDQHNFNVEMRFMADSQARKLSELENGYVTKMRDIADKQQDSIAMQRYNIAIGEISGDVFQAQLAANKTLNKNSKQSLQKFGQRLALGQTGNSTIRLLSDIAREKANVEQQVLNEMDASVGAGIVAEAKAKLRLAEDLRKEMRSPYRLKPKAVMGQKTKWFDLPVHLLKYRELPDMPEYRERPNMPQFRSAPKLVHARFIPGVAPMIGPSVPKPIYPEKPIPVTMEEIMGGSSHLGSTGTGFQNAMDIAKLALDFIPVKQPTLPQTNYSHQFSQGGLTAGQQWATMPGLSPYQAGSFSGGGYDWGNLLSPGNVSVGTGSNLLSNAAPW